MKRGGSKKKLTIISQSSVCVCVYLTAIIQTAGGGWDSCRFLVSSAVVQSKDYYPEQKSATRKK